MLFKLFLLICLIEVSELVLIDDVCSEKLTAINSLDEAKSLVNEININDQKCSDDLRNSIKELKNVISDDNLNDICGDKTYNSIKLFHKNYISTYIPEINSVELKDTKLDNLIPKIVRNFFISFASDVSLLCTRKLIKRFNLELKTKSFQLREIDELKKVRANLLNYLKYNDNRENIIPKHIYDLQIIESKLDEKIPLVLGNENSEFNRVFDGCKVRYNKVLDELFKPVIRLNNLGYGINRLNMQETMSLLSHEYVPWILAINTCDLLNKFDIIIDSSKIYDEPKLVNQEEATKLKSSIQSTNGVDFKLNYQSPMPLDINHETIEYKQLTDQKNIRDVIAKFDTENKRLIKVKLGNNDELTLNEAFDIYEKEVKFTTEKPPQNVFEKVLLNWGR